MLYLPKNETGQFLVSCTLLTLPFTLLIIIVVLSLLPPTPGPIFTNIVRSL